MPNIPKAGAQGQVDVPFAPPDSETGSFEVESGDDRPSMPVIPQQYGPEVPSHGAAGGYDWDPGVPVRTSKSAGSATGLRNPATIA